jgi:hypothetical protein
LYAESDGLGQETQPPSISWQQAEDNTGNVLSDHDRRARDQDLRTPSAFQASIVASDFPSSEAVEHVTATKISNQTTSTIETGHLWNIQLPTLFPFVPSILDKGAEVLFSDMQIDKADKIEAACISYLTHRIGIRDLERLRRGSAAQVSSMRNEIAKYDLGPGLVTEVAKIGVKLLGGIDNKSEYIYGLGADDIMEKVLRWRCSPSPQNRMAIPEPFRPTPLQTMRMDHALSIDFVNWPSIRDQVSAQLGINPCTPYSSIDMFNAAHFQSRYFQPHKDDIRYCLEHCDRTPSLQCCN